MLKNKSHLSRRRIASFKAYKTFISIGRVYYYQIYTHFIFIYYRYNSCYLKLIKTKYLCSYLSLTHQNAFPFSLLVLFTGQFIVLRFLRALHTAGAKEQTLVEYMSYFPPKKNFIKITILRVSEGGVRSKGVAITSALLLQPVKYNTVSGATRCSTRSDISYPILLQSQGVPESTNSTLLSSSYRRYC